MPTIEELENIEQMGGVTVARKWIIEVDVNYGVTDTPLWTRIRGITNQSPSEDPETPDASDYDSYWKSTAVTALGWGWELTVSRKVAADGVTYDIGQEYLRSKSLQIGPGNVAQVRAYEWNGLNGPRIQAYTGLVGVAYAEQGGEMSALSTANVTLSGQGPRYDIAHPLGPVAWSASTVYAVGQQVTIADGSVLQVVVAGTSGATAPTQVSLTDGTVTWKVVVAGE